MKKNIPSIFLIVITIIFSATIMNIDKVPVNASTDNNIFLKEVRKPDGSGYIFDSGEEVNINLSEGKN